MRGGREQENGDSRGRRKEKERKGDRERERKCEVRRKGPVVRIP